MIWCQNRYWRGAGVKRTGPRPRGLRRVAGWQDLNLDIDTLLAGSRKTPFSLPRVSIVTKNYSARSTQMGRIGKKKHIRLVKPAFFGPRPFGRYVIADFLPRLSIPSRALSGAAPEQPAGAPDQAARVSAGRRPEVRRPPAGSRTFRYECTCRILLCRLLPCECLSRD